MNIAIKGHQTRGNEVIQILESLRGINTLSLLGSNIDCYYFIKDNNIRITINTSNIHNYKLYTLEEFEKEFPFKIGDKVKHISSTCIIKEYGFMNNKPVYVVKSTELGILATIPVEMLEPYKEMKEERNITLALDKAQEWYKKGGELKEIALQAFSEKELNPLPRSWGDYCKNYPVKPEETYIDGYSKVIGNNVGDRNPVHDKNICPSRKSAEAHLALIQLEQLRDCYRGLFITVIGMPVWCIVRHKGRLVITQRTWGTDETFLSFQSHEVAEEYLKNFDPLIRQAGDLI